MKNYAVKFKHIAPTFLLIAFGTTLSLLAFRWFFTVNYEILTIKEDIFHLWLPLILPWIPISIWLRPKLRILQFEDKDRGSMFFQVLAWFTIAPMMVVSQEYFKTASGELSELHYIEDFRSNKTSFVTVAEFDLEKQYGSAYTDFRPSGKHNQYLNFDAYFVLPIVSPVANTQNLEYWYGVKFTEQISNKISEEKKEKLYYAFFDKCVEEFESYDFHKADYFEVLAHSDKRNGFLAAIARLNLEESEAPVILEAKYGSFADRNGTKLAWIFGAFGIGFSVFLFALIFPEYDAAEHDRQQKGIKPESDDLVDMLQYLIPKGDHFITSVILDINILVFLIMVLSGVHVLYPNGMELLEWGGNRRLETTGGDWWRIISSMFVHGGVMHLVLNVGGLVIAAIFVEPVLGRIKYLILYLLSGICGSLASIYWYENTISVGASGAIFGLYGSILGLLLVNAFPKEIKKGMLWFVGAYIGINLLFGLTGGIDNAAHIGGLICGITSGIILYKVDREALTN